MKEVSIVTKQDAVLHMGKFGSRLGMLSGIVVGILIGLPIFVIGALFGLFIGFIFGIVVGLASGLLVGLVSVTCFFPIQNQALYRIIAWLICSSLSGYATFVISYQIFTSNGDFSISYWRMFILLLSVAAATIASQRIANWYIKNSSQIAST